MKLWVDTPVMHKATSRKLSWLWSCLNGLRYSFLTIFEVPLPAGEKLQKVVTEGEAEKAWEGEEPLAQELAEAPLPELPLPHRWAPLLAVQIPSPALGHRVRPRARWKGYAAVAAPGQLQTEVPATGMDQTGQRKGSLLLYMQ